MPIDNRVGFFASLMLTRLIGGALLKAYLLAISRSRLMEAISQCLKTLLEHHIFFEQNFTGITIQILSNQSGLDQTWSPDGRQLVFASHQDNMQSSIFLYQLDGWTTPLYSGNPNATSPVWSPDGSQIALISGNADERGVVIVDLNGNLLHEVIDNKSGELQYTSFYNLAWSPDGERIYISTNIGIFSVDLLNNALHRLTERGFYRGVSISSDGKWLVFWAQIGYLDTAGIYLLNLERNQLTRLTFNSEDDYPEFLP